MANIFLQFLEWHFNDVPKGIFRAWKNFLKFNLEYFSIALLLRTLFAPWRQYHYSYGKGFDLKRWAEVFLSNAITRFIGAIMRIILISIGIILETLIFFGGIIAIFMWIFLPILLLIGLCFGFRMLV